MDMLEFDFMQRAFLAGSMIALVASVLGVYLLLRRQALMADMLSHVSLAGVAAGTYLHISPTLCGFIVAVIGALIVEEMRRVYKTYSEIAIAMMMIGGLSTAVVIMSANKSVSQSLSSYLFGSIVAVGQSELFSMLIVAIFASLFFIAFRRPLYHMTFDEETAQTAGFPVRWIRGGFSMATGLIVAAAMPVVGVLLVSSLIVLPAALAIRIAPSFYAAIALAMVIGLTGVIAGLTASYELSTPPGGTIALVLLLMLLAGLGFRALLRSAGQWLKTREQPKQISHSSSK